jgi:carbon-monoxide dehydrogenase iron sulfur subunit
MVLSSGTAKIVVDDGACVGCKLCELICSLHHEGAFHPFLSRIQVVRDPFAGRNVPTVCVQCRHPACVDACPEDAIRVNPLTGAVVIREETCTGCGRCADACPFNTDQHVLRYHPQKKVYLKCDLCDGDPQCVAWCPSGALMLLPAGKEGA